MKTMMTSLCTSSLRLGLTAVLLALPCAGSGCVVNEGDGDDAGDDGTGNDGAPADDGGDDGAPADDGADETAAGGDGGAVDGPSPGTWLYEETGATSNACTFFDASNGYGNFLIAADGAGAFTITPGDDTEPFSCTHDGATFECAERLQEEIEQSGTALQVLVSASGELVSATEMAGTQDGRVVCEGADCAAAEQLLGTTFPCEFSIPWQGTQM